MQDALLLPGAASKEEVSCLVLHAVQRSLGRVDIHRSQIMAPTRNSMDANESAVFS
jgi:hypothetical protein